MTQKEIDLLLLNCSNLPWRPIFPYAFVQVSEVARRFGLDVMRVDLLWVTNWREKIRELISSVRPRAVGIHLRQGDSIDLSDYISVAQEKSPYFRTYFPIEDSKKLIRIIREQTDAPIIMGGFGFTTHAQDIADYLELDLGVRGCPDGFFANFNAALAAEDLAQIPGLVHRSGKTYIHNPIGFYDPSENVEYTQQIVDELRRFYGDRLDSTNPPTIAIEVSRGCPFQCYFCTEPDVKGKRISRRGLDVVEAEMDFLLKNDLYDFWFICSELNIGGTDFVLKLAERVLKLNERYPKKKIRWSGYTLPSLEYDELLLLQRAGYTGAMNDILSLDEDNLREARVPYKKGQAVNFLKSMISLRDVADEPAENRQEIKAELVKYTASTPSQYAGLISFFLGNAHSNSKTIAKTLKTIDEEGLVSYYDEGYVIPSSRVFSVGRTKDYINRSTTISITKDGEADPNTLLPTFYFPEFLIESLGSREAVIEFFDYLTNTFMSDAHKKSKDYCAFVASRLDSAYVLTRFECLLEETGVEIEEFKVANIATIVSGPAFYEHGTYRAYLESLEGTQRSRMGEAVHGWLKQLFYENLETVSEVQSYFGSHNFRGVEISVSNYQFAKYAYQKYSTIDDIWRAIVASNGVGSEIARLYFDYLVYLTSLKIKPNYKELLFDC